MDSDFYLTLLSNSSFDHFPNNKTSQFRVYLNKEIHLDGGQWVIALSEIIYPFNFYNVTKGSNAISVNIYEKHDNQKKIVFRAKLQIDVGHYRTIEELIDEVNDRANRKLFCDLFETKLASRNRILLAESCRINILSNYVLHKDRVIPVVEVEQEDGNSVPNAPPFIEDLDVEVTVEGKLAFQLGYEPDSNILEHILSPHPAGIDHSLPTETFIYVDIVEPQIVSHSASQVLKIVKASERGLKFGEVFSREILNRHYVPVNKKRFQTVSVDLRDSHGQHLPFAYGQSIIQVHFKRLKSS